MKSTASLPILLLFSFCNSNQTYHAQSDQPVVVQAHGYQVPKDSVIPPKVIPVQKPNLVHTKPPKVLPVKSNIVDAGMPRTRTVGKPRVFQVGTSSFSSSERKGIAGRPIAAGTPEFDVVKDATTKSPNPHSFSSFGRLQGLKSPIITGLVEDRFGNLWVATMNGLSKYDGKNFTHYTNKEGLGDNLITRMIKDKDGNLWIGTFESGLSKFDGVRFTNYALRDESANHIFDLFDDHEGNIWFVTRQGLNKFDGTNFLTLNENAGDFGISFTACFTEDANGNLCIGTDNGINIFRDKSFVRYGCKEGLGSDTITSILKDAHGNLWFGERNNGVTMFDGNTLSTFTTKEGLSDNTVTCMIQDRQKNYWFGSRNAGLCKYDGKTFTRFTTEDGLSNDDIRCIFEDSHGNIWVGTYDGLNKYNGETFNHFTQHEGLSDNFIRSIAEDKDGNTWFGTWEGGVNKYDGKTFAHYSVAEGTRSVAVVNMLSDKSGNMWIGDYTGISRFDGKTFVHFKEPADVWSIMQDKSGDIWFSTYGKGALKYDGLNFTHFTKAQGLSSNYLYKIIQDKSGDLWFASKKGGLTKYDGKKFVHFTEKTGLPDNNVHCIEEDKQGNLWIGYLNRGTSRYDGKNFIHLDVRHGLSSNEVRAIKEDSQGNIWFGTASGLSKLEKHKAESLRNVESLENSYASSVLFKSYAYEEGFFGIDVSRGNSIVESKDGTIWIGTIDRLTSFHPGGEKQDSVAPNVQLTGIMLFNEPIVWENFALHKDDSVSRAKDTVATFRNGKTFKDFHFDGLSKWFGIPYNLSLAYSDNNVTFQYVGITIQSPKKVKYQYILEGLESKWNSLTNRTEASYSNLPHGNFTFRVKAMNGDGYWSKEFAYPFRIRPPWWHTWWAYTLFIAATLGVVYALFRYRINQVHHENEIKHKTAALEMQLLRAQMNPHFIFNSLNAINLFILENNKLQASEYLAKFSRLVRLILTNSREAFILLEQELDALNLYLELESLRLEQKFTYSIAIADGINAGEFKIPPLIIQPYVENAIWHGLMNKKDAGRLQVELYLENGELFCKITDNGIGRAQAAEYKSKFTSERKSMGMRITADRIAMLTNGNDSTTYLVVKDLVEADGSPGGTEVTLKIPVSYD